MYNLFDEEASIASCPPPLFTKLREPEMLLKIYSEII